jgi:hypothetical protein
MTGNELFVSGIVITSEARNLLLLALERCRRDSRSPTD